LLAAVVAVTLVAGLNPKGYHFRNDVTWERDPPGLRFGRFGRAHTSAFLTPDQAAILNRDGFTLEIACSRTNDPVGGYRILASVHAGEDRSQLVVGQWQQHVIVMNGDDYSHRRGLPRISADTSRQVGEWMLLTITTGSGGTRLYLNGEEAAANRNLRLTVPAEPQQGRLVIGNSVRANSSWLGGVSGFALYPRVLSPDDATRHADAWRERGNLAFAWTEDPFLLYAFDEGSGMAVRDLSPRHIPLEVPTRLVALGPQAFAPPFRDVEYNRSYVSDVVVNLLGFIPFGFAFAWFLGSRSRSKRSVILRTVVAGLLLSFVIELAQVWLPSRDSSMLDLLLNTLGTLLGAWCITPSPRPASS
jgi:hypothetical protein